MKKGIDTAKSILKGDSEIEIKSPETIEQICEGIEKDLKSHLNVTPGRDNLIKSISGFVRSGDKRQIQDLYDVLFDSAIESKYIDKVVSDIHKLVEDKLEYGEYVGKVKDKDILKTFAEAYGDTDIKIIKQRMEESGALKKVGKITRIAANWKTVVSKSLQGIVITLTGISTAMDGLIATIMKTCNLVLKIINSLSQFFLQTNDSVFAKLFKLDFAGATTTFLQKCATFGTWIVSGGYDLISSNLVDSITMLEGQGLFICIRLLALAYAAYLMVNLFRERSNAYFRLEADTGTDAETVLARFSKERLRNNFGFDKALATDAILATIVSNVEAALKNKKANLTKEETKRLKDLIRAIYKSHKEKTREGIRTFFKEANKS